MCSSDLNFVHHRLRRRGGRPQLKRDPLGGSHPPHDSPMATSFFCRHGTGRPDTGALEECAGARRPATPARFDAARHPTHRTPRGPTGGAGGHQSAAPPRSRGRGAPRRLSLQSSPSDTRLKLAAPGSWGKLSFVTNQTRRRSLSAIR